MAKLLELNAKKAVLKATFERGSDKNEYITNIRLNTSVLPENVALQMLMQKILGHEDLTKLIKSELSRQKDLTESLQSELKGQEYNLTKLIQSELSIQKDLTISIKSDVNFLKEVYHIDKVYTLQYKVYSSRSYTVD